PDAFPIISDCISELLGKKSFQKGALRPPNQAATKAWLNFDAKDFYSSLNENIKVVKGNGRSSKKDVRIHLETPNLPDDKVAESAATLLREKISTIKPNPQGLG